MKLNWFVKNYAQWRKIVRFTIDQALWAKYRQGKTEGIEQGRKEIPECLCCPYYLHAKQQPARLSAYESPDPKTDGKIAAVEGIRQRAFRHQLNSQPSGKLLKIDTDMRQRKQTTGQLDVDTMSLPAMPAPTRDVRPLPGA